MAAIKMLFSNLSKKKKKLIFKVKFLFYVKLNVGCKMGCQQFKLKKNDASFLSFFGV